jgi:hypothetical protein
MNNIREANLSGQQGIIPDRIEIIIPPNEKVVINKYDIKKLHIDKSVFKYVDHSSFAFDSNKNPIFDKLEKGSRIKVFGLVAKGYPVMEVFHGFCHEAKKDWNKRLLSNLIHIEAMGLPVILAKELIYDYELSYTHGFREVIIDLLKPFPIFNLGDVLEEYSKGRVYFDNISILDALRYLAYVKKWCLQFEGRLVSFRPCETRMLEGPINLDDFDSVSIRKNIL